MDLCDNKVGGDGLRSAREGSDRKRRRVIGGIEDRQNGIDRGGRYDRHTNDLRCACCPTRHGICQLFAVQGQEQLPRFRYTDLEQHLIRADLSEIEGIRSGSGNVRSAAWSVLREADIRTRSHGCGIVGRH